MTSSKNKEIAREVYRFGGFSLDAGRRELTFRGREIRLQPRVYDLLLYLLRNRDRAVDKDELQDAVWPGMIVTETALTRAVMKARKAVGDDAGRQVVIKTLHGHGYRFVAPLDEEPPSAEAGDPAAGNTTAGEGATAEAAVSRSAGTAGAAGAAIPASRPRRLRLVALILVVGAAIAVLWQQRAPEDYGSELRVAVLPVTDTTGDSELAWTRLGLMSYVGSLLSTEDEIPVVPDGSVVSLVDGLGWSGDLADAENRELLDGLRRAYGASHVLAIELQREGGRLRMNYALRQPDGRIRQGTMVGDDGAALAQGVVQSVYGLLLQRSRLGADVELVSGDPFNNEAFGRGMSLRLQGRCAEAVPFFRLIVEQEPELVAPRQELASCLRILGEWQEAERHLTALVEKLKPVGPTRPLAQARMVLGNLYNRTGRLDEAEQSHELALEAARAIDDHDLAGRVLQNLAIVAEDRNDWAGAAERLDRAVAEYRRAGLEVLPGQLWSAYGNLQLDQGGLAEADRYFRQALDAFRAVGDRRLEAMMLNNLGLVRRMQGRLDEAEQYHLLSLEIREAIDDTVGIGRIHGQLAVVYLGRGQYDAARESAAKAVSIAREARDSLFEGTSLAQLGDVEKALGRTGEAARRYREARAVFEAIQDRMRVLQADIRLARLDLEEGRDEAAAKTAEAVRDAARGGDLLQPEVEAMELLGDAALARGEAAPAERYYRDALERVRDSGWQDEKNTLMRKLAGLLMDRGELAAAEPLIGALSLHGSDTASLRAQARFAWLSGDAAGAARLMEQARERAGAAWDEASEREYRRYAAAGQGDAGVDGM